MGLHLRYQARNSAEIKVLGKTLIEDEKHKDGWGCYWMPVKRLKKYYRLVMIRKFLNEKCSGGLQGTFTKRSEISSYSTINSLDMGIPKPRLDFTKNSFQLTGAFA